VIKLKTETIFGLIKVAGADAGKLLQGQLTCDIQSLGDNQYQLAAHCNPQGRVISLFYIIHLNNAYYLLMPHNMLDITLSALKKYAVFYKSTLEDASQELTDVLQQIGNPTLFDVKTGVPRIHPQTSGLFLPHDINLDQLNAISFDKGCYTGQEIIARMQYRGKLKKRMHSTVMTTTDAPQPGADHAIGVIVDAMQYDNQCIVLYIAPIHEAE
jgi:hypothetical protein